MNKILKYINCNPKDHHINGLIIQMIKFQYSCSSGLATENAPDIYPWNKFETYQLQLQLPGTNELKHWGRVTHICVSKLRPSLVQIMHCRLIDARPLFEPIILYCYWTLKNKLSKIIIEIHIFSFVFQRKFIWKFRPPNRGHFVQGWGCGDELTQ